MTADVSNGGSVPVLDFKAGRVRWITPEQSAEEIAATCRKAGHYFATTTAGPQPDLRCVCGDVAFKDWRHP